jgi:hypothetical protein
MPQDARKGGSFQQHEGCTADFTSRFPVTLRCLGRGPLMRPPPQLRLPRVQPHAEGRAGVAPTLVRQRRLVVRALVGEVELQLHPLLGG